MSVGIAAQRAVCAVECELAPDLRHMIMVLAVLADHRTGEGMSGQERIAKAMGVSTRKVRRLLAELADASSPVAVIRTPRMRRSGRGRTSDAYVLKLDQPDSSVHVDDPDQADTADRKVRDDQPDKPERPTGQNEHDQPDNVVLASDPIRDPIRDPISVDPKQPTQKRAARRVARAAPIPKSWAPSEAHKVFAAEHGLDVELERVAFLGHYDGQSVKSPNGRFTTWLANQVRWRAERGPRRKHPWVQHGGGEQHVADALRRGEELFGEEAAS